MVAIATIFRSCIYAYPYAAVPVGLQWPVFITDILHLHACIGCTLAGNDTVPISVWRDKCMRYTECLLVITIL